MFAIHYFFHTEDSLQQFFKNVALNLKNRGYFFATCPDGKRVLAELGDKEEINKPLLGLKKAFKGTPQCFGTAFTCRIADTVVEGHEGFSEGSLEYLVFSNALKAVAAKYELYPVEDQWGRELDGMFEEKRGFVRHFKPHFPQSDPSLEDASRLFQAMVFQKRENPNLKHIESAKKYRQAMAESKKRQRDDCGGTSNNGDLNPKVGKNE